MHYSCIYLSINAYYNKIVLTLCTFFSYVTNSVNIQVKASDEDTARDTDIRYSLSGEYAGDGTFTIDANNGDISVTRPLNRDKPKG